MAEKSKVAGSTIGLFEAFGLIFVTLKLTGHIDWSWVWVLAPFWGGFLLLFALFALVELMKERG